MSDGPELSDADFLPRARLLVVDARDRYEWLLRAVRFLLVRGVSFTSIEETLVAVGIPPGPAEQLVELVAQEVEGRVHPPGTYPEVDVPPAVFEALGFRIDSYLHLSAYSPVDAAAPAFAFADPSTANAATVARAERVYRTFVLQGLFLAALLGAFVVLLLLAL